MDKDQNKYLYKRTSIIQRQDSTSTEYQDMYTTMTQGSSRYSNEPPTRSKTNVKHKPDTDASASTSRVDVEEMVKLTQFFFNCITYISTKKTHGPLTPEESLTVSFVEDCLKQSDAELCNLVFQLPEPETKTEEQMILTVIKTIHEAHSDGKENFGRVFASLAFICMYLRYMLTPSPKNITMFSKQLAKFFLKEKSYWLLKMGGFFKGLRTAFPKWWMWHYLKQHYLFSILN